MTDAPALNGVAAKAEQHLRDALLLIREAQSFYPLSESNAVWLAHTREAVETALGDLARVNGIV